MSLNEREIVRQSPVHQDMAVVADDKWKRRWMWNAGPPISLAENMGSRFVGKFDNDAFPSMKPVCLEPHMARATGLYEHRAMAGSLGDMNTSLVDTMLSVPVNSVAHDTAAALTAYDNNPKFCAYMLMRDYERRGLCLFEEIPGVEEEDFHFLLNLVIPVKVEQEWAKTTRVVLNHTFRGPFLDQYKAWLGTPQISPMKAYYNANIGKIAPEGLQRPTSDYHMAVVRALRGAVGKAWTWENSILNTTEQQIRRYRNGHKGKEYYDAADEDIVNPVPPLDLWCLAHTNRTPIDLQEVEATNAASKATNDGLVTAMETFGEKLAEKMQPGVSTADIEAIIERRLADQRRQWEAEKQDWNEKLATLLPSAG